MSIEAMKQALEALEEAVYYTSAPVWSPSMTKECNEAITALRQALSEAQLSVNENSHAIEQAEKQEPVAWRYRSVSPFVGKDGTYKVSDGWTLIHKPEQRDAHSAICGMEAEPLYTTPLNPVDSIKSSKTLDAQPQREWVGLTDEEIALVCAECAASAHNWNDISFAHAIEQALKEKNT